ncbi:prolipoprotein diacylglyceryl transferase [Sneathiella chinensis]|nr:prolipoprotein diacylglyceryl transferase [Sneathiella chinensis]
MTFSTQFLALAFPEIDPVLLQIGPFAIRWYALAYIAGLVIGWRLMMRFAAAPGSAVSVKDVDDFLVWATLGVVLGGRLGYVLFYKPAFYFANPSEILMVWQGGMSFHGGFLGVVVAAFLFCRKRDIPTLALADMLSLVAPVGLFFGRIANFINGELFGRTSDVPWAMVFPNGGPLPRHPSQLYEALLEGALLFAILLWVRRTSLADKPGVLTGLFLVGYAAARGFVELFRQPDAHLGFLAGGTTMGQLLSLPMIVIGLYLILRPKNVKA